MVQELVLLGAGGLLVAALAAAGAAQDVPYGVPAKPWPEKFGLHRAPVEVAEKADAVWVHIPWRRRDRQPEKKQILVVDAATGKEIPNVARASITREAGDLVFQPATVPGEYHIYYMPYKVVPQWGWYNGDYIPPKETADAAWLKRSGLSPEDLAQGKWRSLPQAKVLAIEARTEFDRFDPMEVVATAEETKQLLAANADRPYLVFPEDRRYPIRMPDELPLRWVQRGPSAEFRGEARPNEFYAFQVGVWAVGSAVEEAVIGLPDLRSKEGVVLPASALRCFNAGGVDACGQPLTKTVRVPKGRVQALWFGVDVPRGAKPGEYRGTLALMPKLLPEAKIDLVLTVAGDVLEDRGDGEPWRHSRLRWLDSTLGMDGNVTPPYTPLAVKDRAVRCLGREVRFAETGLPESIRSGTQEILAGPIALVAETAEGPLAWSGVSAKITRQTPAAVAWESAGKAGPMALVAMATMEFDGHLDLRVHLRAREAVDLKDVRLEIPVRREAATYLMGIGRKGGVRPKEYDWKWGGKAYYDSFWLGDVGAGLQCELRGATYSGPMVNLYWSLGQLKAPEFWNNGGKGGVTVHEIEGGPVLVRAYSGPRRLEVGQTLAAEFALLVTPVRPLDTAAHFRSRYYHAAEPPEKAVAAGANIINVHHATPFNPYINYPFIANDKLSAYVKDAHARGAKVKIYYTVRELTNRVTEMWALRSLGHEVLAPGGGGGYPWLREHLASDYAPAWYDHMDGDVSAALVTSGESRWYNYYVEGLAWLLRNIQIDGLYLDDVTYDRRILQRMRKVMERTRPGCLIDLHSNTDFSKGPANQYMEFFPYVDRLWFGEGFNYNDPPDYWLVEISGIPFGLMGEMLQDGGNRWRGMLYGMTAREPWTSGPRHVWKVWDDFGIDAARMVGYWDPSCPVKTGRGDVLATAYVRQARTLVSLASWAPEPARVRLAVDWKLLGLDPAKAVFRAPAIKDFQEAAVFRPDDEIPVPPGRGWLLVMEEKSP